jgi:TATA-box binding protein (TBP) (component of TFIID and TFIIIB)
MDSRQTLHYIDVCKRQLFAQKQIFPNKIKAKKKMFVFYNSPKNLFSQMVTMKLRQPYTTASIWSSGKITCTGANSEDQVLFQSGY